MILQLNNLSFSYHGKDAETKAVEKMSFSVNEGDFVGIVGPSGCGKTTILNLLAGIAKPGEGEILLRGKPLNENTPKNRKFFGGPEENASKNRKFFGGPKLKDAKKQQACEESGKIALMPQRDQLFEWRTIEKNVCLGLEIAHRSNKETKEYGRELLVKYGLKDFMKKHPSELSGGMRQRAALIRTLVTEPDILLLDEPFSALDFQTRLNVCDDVYAIIKQEKKTALLVSHDISESISLCDKVVVLSSRPSHVVAEIDIDLDKSLTPLKRRECADFSKYFEIIWKLLEGTNDGRTQTIFS